MAALGKRRLLLPPARCKSKAGPPTLLACSAEVDFTYFNKDHQHLLDRSPIRATRMSTSLSRQTDPLNLHNSQTLVALRQSRRQRRRCNSVAVAGNPRRRKKSCTGLWVAMELGKRALSTCHTSAPSFQASVASTSTPGKLSRNGVVK
jgi:hypothetical protein